MNWFLLVRFLHIAAAIVFAGGILGRQVVRSVANRSDDIREIAAFGRGASRIENLMVIPGNVVVIVFGVILALLTDTPIFGMLQGADRNWLLATNLLLLVGLLAVPAIFLPHGKKFDALLADALARGQVTPELRSELRDPVVRLAHAYELLSLVVVVLLMVFKPF